MVGGAGAYPAQRLFSAKDERHAAKAFLWFNIAYCCGRPIVVGLASLVYFPLQAGEDPELPIRNDRPPWRLRGLMVVSLFAHS